MAINKAHDEFKSVDLGPSGWSVRQGFPEGWRLPSLSELEDESRLQSPSRYTRADGDFNRDGITDRAYILKKAQSGAEGLWVELSSKHEAARWIQLDSDRLVPNTVSQKVVMGIESNPPGIVPYICFDSESACDVGPPEGRRKIHLRDPSLLYFLPESSASLYFWSFKHKRFLRVWVSD